MKSPDLSSFNNNSFNSGGSLIKRTMWFFTNEIILNSYLFPFNMLKVYVLKSFGARIGKGVVIKPKVNVKYPWNLSIGNFSWIGENVWIDNLTNVTIGENVCISQGSMLLCGNHDYKKSSFDLIVKEIVLEEGAWVGAQCTVCPGVTLHTNSILTVGSVATQSLEGGFLYQGNPALKIRKREFDVN